MDAKLRRTRCAIIFLKSEGVIVLRISARRVLRNGLAVVTHLKEICEKLQNGVFECEE